jgi:hypothetical protein
MTIAMGRERILQLVLLRIVGIVGGVRIERGAVVGWR